jgi:hypothetical protein
MSSNAEIPFPADLLPPMLAASLESIHHGALSNASEQFELDRVQLDRARTQAESDIIERLEQDRPRILAAVALAQIAASYTQSFDAGVRAMLEQPSLRDGAADQFTEKLNRKNGGYAAAAIELSDRANAELRTVRHDSNTLSDPPPVSGGSISGCDLIALGAMLGGATCVMGCGECCIAGAGGALLYVAAC